MSDKELIARLREPWFTNGCERYQRDAADRIEALTKERDAADDLAKAAFADGASNNIRLAETSYRVKWLEAKLEKAVEALRFYAWENEMRLPSDGPWGAGSTDFGKVARATLAEIKGESHE